MAPRRRQLRQAKDVGGVVPLPLQRRAHRPRRQARHRRHAGRVQGLHLRRVLRQVLEQEPGPGALPRALQDLAAAPPAYGSTSSREEQTAESSVFDASLSFSFSVFHHPVLFSDVPCSMYTQQMYSGSLFVRSELADSIRNCLYPSSTSLQFSFAYTRTQTSLL